MSGLLLLCVAVIAFAGLLWAIGAFESDAVKLNLYVRRYTGLWRSDMAKIGDTFTARVNPTNAAGAPAPVFNASYFANGYDGTPAPDGLSAVLVAREAGTGFTLTCTATTAHGATLTETVPLPDVEANVDDEAVALNLTVA